jgi:hypothetical protein
MFGKYAQHGTLEGRLFVEHHRCNVLDALAKARELRFPVDRLRPFTASKVVHSRTADLTLNRLIAIQHRKFERHPLAVVAQGLSPRQQH